jgi:hypothetical protein
MSFLDGMEIGSTPVVDEDAKSGVQTAANPIPIRVSKEPPRLSAAETPNGGLP